MTKVGVMWSAALAVALGSGLAIAETKIDGTEGVVTVALLVQADFDRENLRTGDVVASVAPQRVEVTTLGNSPGEIETSDKIGTTDSDMAPVPYGGNPQPDPTAKHQGSVDADSVVEPRVERAAAGTGLQLPTREGAPDDLARRVPDLQMAQFQLPGTREGTPQTREEARALAIPKDLKFGYAYGSDSEIAYRKDSDLDKRLRDNFVTFAPTLFAFVDYRPTGWLETRLEATLERIFPVREESQVTLPSGEIVFAEKRRVSLLVDQAYVTIKNILGPFELTVGRRNFEDARLWLYDAALDAVVVKHKQGDFHTEASVSRENLMDLDVFQKVKRGRINNYMLYTEYRGFEDHKVAGYAIKRVDSEGLDGRPLLMGVRAYGRPSDKYNYWAEFGISRGKDELSQKLSGRAFDVGGTYRFPGLPLQPSVTLGYAYGSGDGNPNDNKNTEFRQTGLQSNETRFGGLTQFKAYGETIDPELSNLKILTASIGFRAAPNAFVDVVYHKYRTNELTDQIRNWALTAQMNQDDTHLSKDVGSEIDIILGFRNLFGYRRLGFEVRAGWFFPGKAFRNDVTTDPDNPTFRRADKGVSVLAVIIW